jgi:hypothetical protein
VSEISEKNKSIELMPALRFWELREEILEALRSNEIEGYWQGEEYKMLCTLVDKIESISGKENE